MIGLKNKGMVQATEPKTVIIYQDDKGKELFTEWLDGFVTKGAVASF